MIYKKRAHRAVQLLLCFLFNYTALASDQSAPAPSTNENPVKRFNLGDLFGGGNSVNGNLGNGISLSSSSANQVDSTPKTQTIDVAELLAAAQNAASQQQEQQVKAHQEDTVSKFTDSGKKPVDIDISADKNGNLNLADIPGVMSSSNANSNSNANPGISVPISDLQNLIKGKQANLEAPLASNSESNVVKEELDLGKQKLEIESAGKRATRYTLARGPDGGLNLVPVTEEPPSNRQQMQMTTLSQALYSPFPSEQNILHLHLKGKDGKDGKSGNKGPSGPVGPKGPDGPKGSKGDAGTCSSQINGLFECTPDELDSLSNRVDYLEKICKKVETATKKHNLVHSSSIKAKHSNTTGDVDLKTERPKKEKESSGLSEKESSSKEISSKDKESVAVKEKESAAAVKEKESITTTTKEKETAATKEKPKEVEKEEPTKEKETAKEKTESKEKEQKEEAAARIKEKETLKVEAEVEENGVTRGKKDSTEKKEEKKEVKAEPEKEKDKTTEKIENVEKAAEKSEKVESSEKSKEASDDSDASNMTPKKVDNSPPTERSMIDIRAKLKIAELDLMDRIKGAKSR